LQITNKENLPHVANKENFPFALEPQSKRSSQMNQVLLTTRRDMWTYEPSELAMDVVENGTYSLRKASRAWNIPMSFVFDHLNEKPISRKMGPVCVFIEEDDTSMITWTLAMGECGLSISLQQLKVEVVELTQIKATPFWNGICGNN
jgi:hypothetical protein